MSHIQRILQFPHLSQTIIAWKSMDFGEEEKWEEACLNFPFHKMRISVVPTWKDETKARGTVGALQYALNKC